MYTEEEIVFASKEAVTDTLVAEVLLRTSVSEQSFYGKAGGGPGRRVAEPEAAWDENRKLKQLVADLNRSGA
jgi:hypothetical protein